MSRSASSYLVAAVLLTLSLTSNVATVESFSPGLGPVVRSHSTTVCYAKTNGDAFKDSEYVFISMEEAEEALRQERASFDKERQELKSMVEAQRTQLEELTRRQA